MSLIVLVRHGKASAFSQHDYDQLSETGFEQSRELGRYWAREEVRFDRVYVGPRRRHQETHDTVAAILRESGRPLPDPIPLADLDEHAGIKLIFALLPELGPEDPTLRAIAATMAQGETPAPRDMLATFRALMRRWARGEVTHETVEAWSEFRKRVARSLDIMTEGLARGETVAAFTSAGAVAAAIGHVLDLDDTRVIDLSFSMHNAALSELTHADGSFHLRSFNCTPHLERTLITAV